jgi:hypothetical protein|nr:MAG TPA_asm: protein of unknown function (DUF4083) [Caudoviricetes sp.]
MEEWILWLCVVAMFALALVISILYSNSSRLFHIDEKLTELEAKLSREEKFGGSE